MSGINNFLSKGAKPDRVKQFELLSVGKSKEEIRELEMMLLQPEEMVEYTGQVHRYGANDEFAVRMVMPDQSSWDLLTKHFTICNYVEKNISNISLLMDMLNALESSKLIYNKKERTFSVPFGTEMVVPVEEKPKRKCAPKKRAVEANVLEEALKPIEAVSKNEPITIGEKRDVRSFFGRS